MGAAWPDPRFTDNGDGTVTDNLTGLMWTQDANLAGLIKNWQEGMDYVAGMNAGTYTNFGYTDWRLPNRKELHSLTDYSQSNPALPSGHPFSNVQSYGYWRYWSSSDSGRAGSHVWNIHMGNGGISIFNKILYGYVWPVRAGWLKVEIDIKPGSDPNSINLKSKGVIPVAILTTEDFDATTVDPLSVEFGPDGAMEAHEQGHIEDADGDGALDLVLHFKTQDTGIQCGDTEASLTGETYDGQVIEGFDSINTMGCK